MFSAFIAAISRANARARAVAMLRRLDDHRLRDLGIARDQIEAFVDGRL